MAEAKREMFPLVGLDEVLQGKFPRSHADVQKLLTYQRDQDVRKFAEFLRNQHSHGQQRR